MSSRLERSNTNKVIAGVCGGIAEYLEVDPTLVRAFFVLSTIFTAGLGILGYIVLLLLMPLPGRPPPFVSSAAPFADAPPAADAPAPGENDPGSSATTVQPARVVVSAPETAERRRAAIGYLLVALGVLFLLGNIGALRFVRWELVWPVVLIALGGLLLVQRVRR